MRNPCHWLRFVVVTWQSDLGELKFKNFLKGGCPQTTLGKLILLALAYLRYNLKPASPSNLASMLLVVVTLTLGSMQISICINRGFQLVSVYINTYDLDTS